jgi:hypothetical protein
MFVSGGGGRQAINRLPALPFRLLDRAAPSP